MTAMTTAATAPAPHDPIRHSELRSNSFSSAKSPDSTPPVFSVPKVPAKWSDFFAIKPVRPAPSPPESRMNLNRKCAPDLNPGRLRGTENSL